jgi:ribosomal protein S18 acetylase RimI-like enzyme
MLWDHCIRYCEDNGIDRITLVTSPQAVGFYTKQGAVQVGEAESLVRKGRIIPKLVYDIKKCRSV